jgi:Tfp pilus assembly PilM family ATPase
MEENLQIKSQVMDPFANLETKEKISIEDPAQYAVATGLAVRKGFEA